MEAPTDRDNRGADAGGFMSTTVAIRIEMRLEVVLHQQLRLTRSPVAATSFIFTHAIF